MPGGKLLLMATEDTFTGAVCSRLWHCRTYNRTALRKACAERIRAEERFDSVEALVAAMHRDVEAARRVLEPR